MYKTDFNKFLEYQTVYDNSTPGVWSIWDGPAYCGGGKDLCIGAGEDWIANMDHRYGENYKERVSHDSAGDCKNPDCHICSFSEDVTKEQSANALFITKAKNEIIPWCLQEIKNLEFHYHKSLDLLERIKNMYYEKFPPEELDLKNKTDEEIQEMLDGDELENLIKKIEGLL